MNNVDMNKISGVNWFGTIGWVIVILLLLGAVGMIWLKYNKSKKSTPTSSTPQKPTVTFDTTMEELHNQREALNRKRQEVLEQYHHRQRTEQSVRVQWDRLNTIQNTFLREFGLVERMVEIQKCLSMETYTGSVDTNVLYTQLTNMLRDVRQLEDKLMEPTRSDPQELYIPGWFAMGETETRLQSAPPSGQSLLMKLYRSQMEDVRQALEKQLSQEKAAAAPQLPKAETLQYWESRLAEVKQMLGDPEAMDEAQRVKTAQRLAKYAVEYFKDRL